MIKKIVYIFLCICLFSFANADESMITLLKSKIDKVVSEKENIVSINRRLSSVMSANTFLDYALQKLKMITSENSHIESRRKLNTRKYNFDHKKVLAIKEHIITIDKTFSSISNPQNNKNYIRRRLIYSDDDEASRVDEALRDREAVRVAEDYETGYRLRLNDAGTIRVENSGLERVEDSGLEFASEAYIAQDTMCTSEHMVPVCVDMEKLDSSPMEAMEAMESIEPNEFSINMIDNCNRFWSDTEGYVISLELINDKIAGFNNNLKNVLNLESILMNALNQIDSKEDDGMKDDLMSYSSTHNQEFLYTYSGSEKRSELQRINDMDIMMSYLFNKLEHDSDSEPETSTMKNKETTQLINSISFIRPDLNDMKIRLLGVREVILSLNTAQNSIRKSLNSFTAWKSNMHE